MDSDFIFLISAYNETEARNIAEILETEGIKARMDTIGDTDFISSRGSGAKHIDIYVNMLAYEDAARIIEVELVRGDF